MPYLGEAMGGGGSGIAGLVGSQAIYQQTWNSFNSLTTSMVYSCLYQYVLMELLAWNLLQFLIICIIFI